MKKSTFTPLMSDAEILGEALVSDSREIMRLNELAEDFQIYIAKARIEGFRPVSVRWPGGQFALMFCEKGTDMPSAANVIAAYRGCLETNAIFPEGVESWSKN